MLVFRSFSLVTVWRCRFSVTLRPSYRAISGENWPQRLGFRTIILDLAQGSVWRTVLLLALAPQPIADYKFIISELR